MANTAVEAPEEPPKTAKPLKEPKKRPRGRPKLGEGPFVPTARNFFERLKEISQDDWGTRANVHLYRLEPYTDRLRSGTVVHIMKYAEPIDEDRIMMDHGSGRYRAMLTFRKPSQEKGDELDRQEFEILNLKFPPRVPKGEWVDDPRNKKWAWAKNFYDNEGAPPPSPSPTDNVVENFRVYNEIRDSIKADIPTPAQQQLDPLQMIRAVKEVLPAPAPPTDNTLLNTVVALMTKQIEASAAEARELRQEVREVRNGPKTAFNVESIVQGAEKLFPLIERIWPAAKDGLNRVRPVRSNMSGWQEFLQPIIPSVINSPIWGAIATQIATARQQPPAAPMSGQHMMMPPIGTSSPAQPPGTQGGVNPLIGFMQEIARPMLNHLLVDADGAELGEQFGAFVYDGWSGDPRYEQVISIARTMGPAQITAVFQQAPPIWNHIAPIQAKFAAFLEAFLKWTPATEDEEAEEVIDLDEQERVAAAHHG